MELVNAHELAGKNMEKTERKKRWGEKDHEIYAVNRKERRAKKQNENGNKLPCSLYGNSQKLGLINTAELNSSTVS